MKYNLNIFFISSVNLILGILLANSWLYLLLLMVVSLVYCLYYKKYALSRGLTIGIISYIFGVYITSVDRQDDQNHHLQFLRNTNGYFAKIVSAPKKKLDSQEVTLEIRPTTLRQRPTKIQAYFASETKLHFGDLLFVMGAPTAFDPPSVPMGFDYRGYMQRKGITHRHYIKHCKVVGHEKHPLPIYYAMQVRAYCEEQIKTYVRSPESGLLIAMVLGIKDGLDRELRAAYQATGTMHILAVSGLHVGILFYLITVLLAPLKKLKYGKGLFVSTALGLLWFYAVVTGLSPSVMRAVTMLSVGTLGLVFARQGQVLNTIGFTAFVLITIDPKIVYDIGFQYSFAAVLGIVLLYKPLYSIASPQNRILDYVWQLFCVSLAAQLATSPLSLYYFHKFPTYFWLANVFVVPMAFFVLASGLLLLAVSWMSPVAIWVGKGCELLVYLMNGFVLSIEKFPFAVLGGFFPSQAMVIVQYILIALVFLYFIQKKSWHLTSILFFALLHITLEWYQNNLKSNTSLAVVGDFRPASGLIVVENGNSKTLLDTALSQETYEYKLGSFLDYYPNRPISVADTFLSAGRWIYFKGQKFWHISKPPQQYPVCADYIIVGRNSLKINHLKKINCKEVILDASNSFGYIKRFQQEAEKLGIAVHSVRQEGLWQKNL